MASKFDWSQMPTEQAGSGSKFDWNQMPAEQGPQTGSGQAALEHFGNAAAMGYLPQAQALAAKVTPDPNADVDAKLKSQGFDIRQSDPTYLQNRDANIARMAQESKEHPIASGVGTVGGIASSGIALGALAPARAAPAATAAGRALQAGTRVVQGAKTGAIMAGLANPGDTAGEIDPLQIDKRIDNAKTGAVVGGAVQGAIEAAPAVWSGIKFAGKKVAASLSGLNEGVIDQYANRTDQINQMIRESGGEMTAAADQMRQEAQTAIRNTRAQYSSQIGKALESAPKDPVADITPVVGQLEKVKARLNPNLQSEAAEQIDDTIAKLKTEAAKSADGKVSVQQLNQITDFLQGRAKSAYMKGGAIFQNAQESSQAAKGAAAISRKMLNELSPDIAQANNKLALLHTLEDRLNPNLIKPGAPDSALIAAGAGSNPRNAKVMQAMGDASGYPLMEKAKDLAAARSFANPSLLPSDFTGKAVARQVAGAGLGGLMAGPLGAAVGGAAASPASVKLAVNAANIAGRYVPQGAGEFVQRNPMLMQRTAQAISSEAQRQGQPDAPPMDNLPQRGPAAWANQGLKNLGIQDQRISDRLMSSPKAQQLLIQASDLKPGSKAMQKINDQIQAILKGAK